MISYALTSRLTPDLSIGIVLVLYRDGEEISTTQLASVPAGHRSRIMAKCHMHLRSLGLVEDAGLRRARRCLSRTVATAYRLNIARLDFRRPLLLPAPAAG